MTIERPYLAIVAIAFVYLLLAYLIPPGADTLWRLHIARGILDGQVLYRDFIEVNPPLWFWGAIPAAALGGYLAVVGINLVATFIALVVLSALASRIMSDDERRIALVGFAAAVLLVNVAEIGQREQAFLVACVLWSALIAVRIEGKVIPIWLALTATLFCAYGFALKHYFVIVPVVCEIILLIYLKRQWRPFRPETLCLAGLAITYAIAVVTLTPDFLGRMLSLVQASYAGFGAGEIVPNSEWVRRTILLSAPAGLALSMFVLVRDKQPFLRLLVVCCLCAVAIVVVQGKYWRYHIIAANGLAVTAILVAWSQAKFGPIAQLPKARPNEIIMRYSALILLTLTSFQPAFDYLRTNGQPIDPALKALIDTEPKAHHIAVLSTAPDNAFYPLARAGRPHWTRHFSMWMLPSLYALDPKDPILAARQHERALILGEFTADIMCTPPDLIIGEVGNFRNAARTRFDAMGFLKEDAGFTAWLDASYAPQSDVSPYPIWRLKGQKPPPSRCAKPPSQ